MPIHSLDGVTPKLPKSGDFWVAPGAHVIGNVRLGEGVTVWFGAVIRGDNEEIVIGDGTNVQDNSVLHSDAGAPLTIGVNVTIGHRVTAHGCTIADDCLIGMGATILNRAKIARNCIVGAGALVTEGKEFPEGSLIVGAPAKVMRPLTERDIAMIRASAAGYVANGRRYAQGLKPIG